MWKIEWLKDKTGKSDRSYLSLVVFFFIIFVIPRIETEGFFQKAIFFFQRFIEFGEFGQLDLERFAGGGNVEEIFGESISLSWSPEMERNQRIRRLISSTMIVIITVLAP